MQSLHHCDVKKKLHWKACQDLISRFPALCWHGADWNIWPWRQDDIFWLGTFTTTRAYEQFEVETHCADQQNEKKSYFLLSLSEPNRFLGARITSSSAYLFQYYQLSFFGPGIEALTLSLRASLFALLPNMSCFKQKFYFLFKSSSSEFNLDFESCLLSLSLCDTEAPHF